MADVSQLAADIQTLKQAVADDQTAINAVQSYAQAQAAQIQTLEQQLASLPLQSGGAQLDLSGLEDAVTTLKQQNQALQSIIPQQATTTPSGQPTPASPNPPQS